MDLLFDLNPGLILWTIVSFLLLLFILGKFAWKPMLNALNEREEKIRGALEEADRARTEAAEMIKQNEKNLARAEEEYRKLIGEGKALAEKLKEEMLSKARQQAQQTLTQAAEEIQRSVETAKQQLREEMADLAVKAAEKILEESLDGQKQKKIADSVIRQLPKN